MSAHDRKIKFVNFYKLNFPLAYNPEIGKEGSVGESHSHLSGFFILYSKTRGTSQQSKYIHIP